MRIKGSWKWEGGIWLDELMICEPRGQTQGETTQAPVDPLPV